MRLLCFVVLGLLFGQCSHAEEMRARAANPGLMPGGGWTWSSNTNYGDPAPQRAWSQTAAGIRANATHNLSGRAGALAVVRPLTASMSSVGAAIARCWGNALCAAGTMIAVPLVLDRIGAKRDPITGELKQDPGVTPTGGGQPWHVATSANAGYLSGFVGRGMPTNNGAEAASLAGEIRAAAMAQYPSCNFGAANLLVGSSIGIQSLGGCGAQFVTMTYYPTGSPTSCPASTDPFNPAYNVPAGQPTMPDGRCPTARYNWQPTTPTAVGTRLAAYPPGIGSTEGQNGIDALREVLERGEVVPDATPSTITGPSSQTGTPTTTTTTTPTGTRTETATPTYNYTYSPTSVTYNTSNTTVINEGGQTTTITTTTPSTATEPAGDLCEANPEILACKELGETPNDQVPTETRNLTYGTESVGLPEGCPADVALIRGEVWSYAQTCSTALSIRPLVIGVAAFIAACMVVAALRQA